MLPLVIVACIITASQAAPSLSYEKLDENNDNVADFRKLEPIRILTNNDPISSESSLYSSPNVETLAPCEGDLVRRADGICVKPILNKNVFVYSGPEIAAGPIIPAAIPDPSIDLNYVFLKVPNQIHESKSIVIPPPQQKTAVYVLQENQKLPSPELIELPFDHQEPDVYFVNYNEGENLDLPGDVDLKTALSSSITLGEVINVNEDHSTSDESFPDIDLRTVTESFSDDSFSSDSAIVNDVVSSNDETVSFQFNESEAELEEESTDDENEESADEENNENDDEENDEKKDENNVDIHIEESVAGEGEEEEDSAVRSSILRFTADEESDDTGHDQNDEDNNAITFGTKLLDEEEKEEDEKFESQDLNEEGEDYEETSRLDIKNGERQNMEEFMNSLRVEDSKNKPLTRLYSTGFSNYFLENINGKLDNSDELNQEKLGPTFENLNIYKSPVTIYTLPYDRLVSDLSKGSNIITDQRLNVASEFIEEEGSDEHEVLEQKSELENENEESVILDSFISVAQESENDSEDAISFSTVFVGEAKLIDEYQKSEISNESRNQINDDEDEEESDEKSDRILLRSYSKPSKVFESAEILRGSPVFLSPKTLSINSQFKKSIELTDDSSEVTVLKGRAITLPPTKTIKSVINLRDSSGSIISKISPFSSSSINGAFERHRPAKKRTHVPILSSSHVNHLNSGKSFIPVRISLPTNTQQLQTVRASPAPLIGRVQLHPNQQFSTHRKSNGIQTLGKSFTSRNQQKQIFRTNSVSSIATTQRPRAKQIVNKIKFNPSLRNHGVVSSNNARRVTAPVSRQKQISFKTIPQRTLAQNQNNRGKSSRSKSSSFLLDHIETRLNPGTLTASRTFSSASGKSLSSNLNSRSQFISTIPRRRFNNGQFKVILKS